MKKFTKITLLLASIPFVLASCEELTKKAYCLDTSATANFVETQYCKTDSSKCYQLSSYDVLEVFYLINNPINPDADPKEYQYDFTWKQELKNSYFEFVDGLEGKVITSAFKLADNVVKINVKGRCENAKATGGYLKIYRLAFDAHTKVTQDASLYAYLTIGLEGGFDVDKPSSDEQAQ